MRENFKNLETIRNWLKLNKLTRDNVSKSRYQILPDPRWSLGPGVTGMADLSGYPPPVLTSPNCPRPVVTSPYLSITLTHSISTHSTHMRCTQLLHSTVYALVMLQTANWNHHVIVISLPISLQCVIYLKSQNPLVRASSKCPTEPNQPGPVRTCRESGLARTPLDS